MSTQPVELFLNPEKLGRMTVQDLVEFADLHGCELQLQFIRTCCSAMQPPNTLTGALLADALQERQAL